ncbi:MAG: hypothetical protein ABL917_02355 [Parcubacteria group bacterium]
MNILITTGIYPPKIGGPAQYAKNLNEVLGGLGHRVTIKTFTIENYLPTGLRHLWFFVKIIPSVLGSDLVLSLDTFSVGFPSVCATKIFGKKIIIRTGGDFLWEGYVERTGDKVLLSDFYKTKQGSFSLKERIIFKITRWTLNNCNILVFSTKWQRDIFKDPYSIDLNKTAIVENYYGEKKAVSEELPDKKVFVAGTRPLVWKNISILKNIFEREDVKNSGIILDTENAKYEDFLKKIASAYAVILVSLGDISPNMILDAIRLNKPFIVTRENGLIDRVGDLCILVNPEDENDIKDKIMWLLNEDNYRNQIEKIKNFSFTHSWHQIANEYVDKYNSIK